MEKGDKSVNIAWESKQYFHLKTFSSIETRPLIGEIKLRLLSLFGQLPRELGERRAELKRAASAGDYIPLPFIAGIVSLVTIPLTIPAKSYYLELWV